ncbi:hypothetical protein, partial [Micrococcus luteus]
MGRFGLHRTSSAEYKRYLRSQAWGYRRVRWFADCRQAGQEPACQVCGITLTQAGTLDLHHVSYKGVGQDEEGRWQAREAHNDLMPLCRDHHQRLHQIMDGKKEFFGWDRRRATCQGPLSSAHRRPVFLPAGGHQNCPLVASWFA